MVGVVHSKMLTVVILLLAIAISSSDMRAQTSEVEV